jgi:hypothetical protein
MPVKMPASDCLNCGRRLDGATGVGQNAHPDAGSLSVCLYRGAVTAYDDDLRLRPLTEEEVKDIQADKPTFELLQRATRLIHFYKAGRN